MGTNQLLRHFGGRQAALDWMFLRPGSIIYISVDTRCAYDFYRSARGVYAFITLPVDWSFFLVRLWFTILGDQLAHSGFYNLKTTKNGKRPLPSGWFCFLLFIRAFHKGISVVWIAVGMNLQKEGLQSGEDIDCGAGSPFHPIW